MAWPFTRSKPMQLAEFLAQNPSTALEIASPWSVSNAQMVAWSDFFNEYAEIVTREVAVRVPAVARAEKLLVGLADVPLIVERYDAATKTNAVLDTQPSWTQRTDGPITLWHRMAATIRDCYYEGWSLWAASRGSEGQVLTASHVHKQRIDTSNKVIKIDGRVMSEEEIIFFPGPGMGLLGEAQDTIRGARQMDKNWVARTGSPIPLVVLKQIEDSQLSDEEIDALKKSWMDARAGLAGGVVGFVPKGFDIDTHTGIDDAALFIEGDNKVRLNIANYSNIPASMLDGSTATASLTYVTAEGNRSSFHEETVRYWLAPIEHRLSQDDVVPAGQRTRFDVRFIDRNNPQEVTSD